MTEWPFKFQQLFILKKSFNNFSFISKTKFQQLRNDPLMTKEYIFTCSIRKKFKFKILKSFSNNHK